MTEHYHKRHLFCPTCRRGFRSENNLRAHLRSYHHIAANIPCGAPGCPRKVAFASDLAQHCELGSCPGGAKLDNIDRLALALDNQRLITLNLPSTALQYQWDESLAHPTFAGGWDPSVRCVDAISAETCSAPSTPSPSISSRIGTLVHSSCCTSAQTGRAVGTLSASRLLSSTLRVHPAMLGSYQECNTSSTGWW